MVVRSDGKLKVSVRTGRGGDADHGGFPARCGVAIPVGVLPSSLPQSVWIRFFVYRKRV